MVAKRMLKNIFTISCLKYMLDLSIMLKQQQQSRIDTLVTQYVLHYSP